MVMSKNISDQEKGARLQIYLKTTHREHQKLREKLKIGKKTTESLTNVLLSKKTS